MALVAESAGHLFTPSEGETLSKRDRLFAWLGGKASPLGFGWGDLWRKENKVVRYAWWIGSRGIYLWLRPIDGLAIRVVRFKVEIHAGRKAVPRFLRVLVCARRGHVPDRWIHSVDSFECLCGAETLTGMAYFAQQRG